MTFHRIPALLTTLLASAPAAAATDVLLDFSGGICGEGSNQTRTNGSAIGEEKCADGCGDAASNDGWPLIRGPVTSGACT